jgi:hypothetical protein
VADLVLDIRRELSHGRLSSGIRKRGRNRTLACRWAPARSHLTFTTGEFHPPPGKAMALRSGTVPAAVLRHMLKLFQ